MGSRMVWQLISFLMSIAVNKCPCSVLQYPPSLFQHSVVSAWESWSSMLCSSCSIRGNSTGSTVALTCGHLTCGEHLLSKLHIRLSINLKLLSNNVSHFVVPEDNEIQVANVLPEGFMLCKDISCTGWDVFLSLNGEVFYLPQYCNKL